jgi:hypothetical protein
MSRVILAADMKGSDGYLLPELISYLAIRAPFIYSTISSCLQSIVGMLGSQLYTAEKFVGI